MKKRSRLSKHRQTLVIEYIPLAQMLAKFFLKARPGWQKSVLLPDLEAEGFLALTKAARTYDKTKLPYPKAYFARACMNAMYKWIRKQNRQPADWKISLEEASDLLPVIESPDYLQMAIDDLGPDADLATDRFQNGHTLRTIAADHQISLRLASVRSRALAARLAEALEIRLSPRGPSGEHPLRGSNRNSPSSSAASERHRPSGR
jgi:DNA-directed RNA polymerase specialized sigma24 family protein